MAPGDVDHTIAVGDAHGVRVEGGHGLGQGGTNRAGPFHRPVAADEVVDDGGVGVVADAGEEGLGVGDGEQGGHGDDDPHAGGAQCRGGGETALHRAGWRRQAGEAVAVALDGQVHAQITALCKVHQQVDVVGHQVAVRLQDQLIRR